MCSQDQHLGCFAYEIPVIKGPVGIVPRVSHRPCPDWQRRCVPTRILPVWADYKAPTFCQFWKFLWNMYFYLLLLVHLECEVERWKPCDGRKQEATHKPGDHSEAWLTEIHWPTLKVLRECFSFCSWRVRIQGTKVKWKTKFFRHGLHLLTHVA